MVRSGLISVPVFLQIGPELTLMSVSAIAPREPFSLYGAFLNWVGGYPRALPNREVTLYRNGVSTGLTSITDNGGGYDFVVSEAEVGSYSYYTMADSETSNTVSVTVTSTPVTTSVTIAVSKTSFPVGENITVNGYFKDLWNNPIYNYNVDLLVNGVVSGIRGLTDVNGYFAMIFPVGLYGGGTYNLQTSFAGDGMLQASTSTIKTVTITKQATSLSMGVSPVDGQAPLVITVDGYLKRTSDNTGIDGATINLLVDGVVVKSVVTQLTPQGYYTTTYTLTEVKTYSVQTEFLGDDNYEGC
jgi:hypothetical protein